MGNEKTQAPLIGANFSGPLHNAPRKPLQGKEAVQEEKAEDEEGQEEQVEEKIQEAVANAKSLTPAEKAQKYRDDLEKAGIPLERARSILDAVIFKNVYVQDLTILGRLKVGIRTRVYDDLQRIMHALESEAPAFPVHTDDLIARYNVAASLAYYQDTQFEFPDPATASVDDQTKAFQKRMKFLLALPTPVTMKLIEAVNKFDQDMSVVFAEGAPEDF